MRPARPRSTARRLIVLITGAMTIVLLLTTTVSILVVHSFIHERASTRLIEAAHRISASVTGLPGLQMDVTTIDNMAKAGSAAVILGEGDNLALWVNTDAETARLAFASAGRDGRPHDVTDRADLMAIHVDLADVTVRDGATTLRPTSVVVAVSTAAENAAMRTIAAVMLAGMAAAIAALVLLTVVIIRRGLSPLHTMAGQARRYADGDRAVRLPANLADADMAHLAITVNQALEAQQAAEHRLRSFVADASHELRTPLTVASGWVELDLQGGLPETDRRDQAMGRVQAQLGRMRLLVDELALLARLDRTRPLTLEDVDLATLAGEVVEDARIINPDRHFTLHATAPAALSADRIRLQQVLANLVSNAVQHTPAGTPVEVTVQPAPTTDPAVDPMHTLLVTDKGPGIPVADQRHIFERFWRGDTSRARRTGGSGLGLAIVSSIVAAHGGTCDVVSAPGYGTTIRVRLPAHTDPVRARAASDAVAAPLARETVP